MRRDRRHHLYPDFQSLEGGLLISATSAHIPAHVVERLEVNLIGHSADVILIHAVADGIDTGVHP